MKHSPGVQARKNLSSRLWARLSLPALLLLLMLVDTACTVGRNPVTGRKRAYGYSWEQERQIGQQQDQAVIQQFGVYDDDELQRYVDRVAREVLAESHMRRPDTPQEFRETPFTFRILDSPTVNAFALPGGYVYLTRGLLTHLENEAQLAVVLGHEIAHVAARHASAQAAKQQIGQIGLLAGVIGATAAGAGGAAENLLNLGGQAAQLLFLSYSRENEEESDNLGVEYAALAGYEAAEGAAFFRSLQRIGAEQGGGLPTFLSTHPDPGSREQRIPQLAAEWRGRPGVNMQKVGTEIYHQHLEGVILGEDPRAGFVENHVFYHPELRFQFPVPRNFLVQNSATQVAMIDQNQRAVMVFTFANASSVREAAAQFAQQQGLQVIESAAVPSDDVPAYYVLAEAATQQGQRVRVLSYFVEYGGNIYQFVGYAAAQDFSNYNNLFLQTMRGFTSLRDQRILNIQPTRINVVEAPRRASFQSLVPRNLPPQLSASELAILNQVELDEVIPAGTLLKMPE